GASVSFKSLFLGAALCVAIAVRGDAQDTTQTPTAQRAAAARRAYLDSLPNNPVRILVSRLSLDRYKTTLAGLSSFGDRRQGTERNRKAMEWIEAQLKSYGCPTERITYTYTGRQLRTDSTDRVDSIAGFRRPARGGGGGRGGRGVTIDGVQYDQNGNVVKGPRGRSGVNSNAALQPDTTLRRINAER